MSALAQAPDGALIFTNFVDFDMFMAIVVTWPVMRCAGTAGCPFAELEECLQTDDLVIVSADHGKIRVGWYGSYP